MLNLTTIGQLFINIIKKIGPKTNTLKTLKLIFTKEEIVKPKFTFKKQCKKNL